MDARQGRRTLPSVLLLVIVLALAPAVPARADCPSRILFPPGTNHPVPFFPTRVIVGDFNRDDIADLAITLLATTVGSGGVIVRLGSGTAGIWDGTYRPDAVYAVGLNADSPFEADFTGDGIQDLAFSAGDSGFVRILPGAGASGAGDGTFSEPVSVAVGAYTSAPAVGDFNGDGILDLAVIWRYTRELRIFFGQGAGGVWDGTFSTPVVRLVGVSGATLTRVVSGDLNEDNIPDLVITQSWPDHAVFVLLGTGTGGAGDGDFAPPVKYALPGPPDHIAITDVNGDGTIDIVTSAPVTVAVLLNERSNGVGSGAFAAAVSTPTSGAGEMGFGDFDHDGLLDLVIARGSDDLIAVHPGRAPGGAGEGIFGAPTAYVVGPYPRNVAVADLNRDGFLDLVVPIASSLRISILIAGCQPLPAPRVGLWAENGIPLCTAPGVQTDPRSVADGSGGALFVWRDLRAGSPGALYGIRIDRLGNLVPGWTRDGVPIASRILNDGQHQIVSDGQGGMLAAWREVINGWGAIRAQHLLADGSVDPAWPADGLRVGPLSVQDRFAMDSDGMGGAVFAWHDQRNGGQVQVYAHRITGTGAVPTGWPIGGLALTSGTYVGSHDWPSVASDGMGGVYVAWFDGRICQSHGCTNPPPRTLLRAVAGTVEWTRRYDGQFSFRIVPDGSGGVLWTWGRQTSKLAASRVDSIGTLTWSTVIQNSPGADGWMGITGDGIDGCYTWWLGRGPSDLSLAAARLTSAGAPAPGWPAGGRVVSDAPRDQWRTATSCVLDGLGGAFFSWHDYRSGFANIYGVSLYGEGLVRPGWTPDGNIICDAAGGQDDLTTVASEAGNVIAAWADGRNGATDIYAQRIQIDSPVAATVSLIRAEAEPAVARLQWYVFDGRSARCKVMRRTEIEPWMQMGEVLPDGDRRVSFDDRDVTPGQRYAYRLALGTPPAEQYSEETWLTIPGPHVLSLEGARPNPAAGELRITFSLASREPANLELFDLAGRLMASRAVGGLGPGPHDIALEPPEGLAAGLYFVRLTQRQVSLTSRVAIIR